MWRTYRAELDEKGNLHFREPVPLHERIEVLVTLLNESSNYDENVETKSDERNLEISLRDSVVYEGDLVSPIGEFWDVEQ